MKAFFRIIIPVILLCCLCTGLPAEEEIRNGERSEDSGQSPLIVIDHDFSDWEKIPTVARFSSLYNPAHFNREMGGKSEVLPITDAAYWGFNGTKLKEVKAVIDNNSLYFYFSTQSPIAKGLLLFLYLYQTRNTEQLNTYTIEITVDVNTGKGNVFLWESDNEEIKEIGITRVSPWYIECGISLDILPQLLKNEITTQYSCDLTTCFYEKSTGMYEEFYFTTIFFKDISEQEGL